MRPPPVGWTLKMRGFFYFDFLGIELLFYFDGGSGWRKQRGGELFRTVCGDSKMPKGIEWTR